MRHQKNVFRPMPFMLTFEKRVRQSRLVRTRVQNAEKENVQQEVYRCHAWHDPNKTNQVITKLVGTRAYLKTTSNASRRSLHVPSVQDAPA